MNEIQIGNYDSIVNGVNGTIGFGVKPSPDVEKEWRAMSDEIAACGTMENRLGLIANPMYAEIKDFDGLEANYNWLYGDEIASIAQAAERFGGVSDLVDIRNPMELAAWHKNPKGQIHFNAMKQYKGVASFGCTKAMCYPVMASVKMPAALKSRFGCAADQLTFKDLDGNELDGLYGLYDKLYDGKTCSSLSGSHGKGPNLTF